MNTYSFVLKGAGAFALGVACWAAAAACSSDNNNPAPMMTDDGGGSSSSGGGAGSSSSSGGGSTDDAACGSDAATCNSCTTSDTDPYNACSSFVTNCIPFDDTRVPAHPTL
jgi:hypothetical protein